MASHNVHAESHGILWRLGVPEDGNWILSGPSVLGLTDPLHAAAVSLFQATVAVVCAYPLNLDKLVALRILESLQSELGDEALAADEKARLKRNVGGSD